MRSAIASASLKWLTGLVCPLDTVTPYQSNSVALVPEITAATETPAADS